MRPRFGIKTYVVELLRTLQRLFSVGRERRKVSWQPVFDGNEQAELVFL